MSCMPWNCSKGHRHCSAATAVRLLSGNWMCSSNCTSKNRLNRKLFENKHSPTLPRMFLDMCIPGWGIVKVSQKGTRAEFLSNSTEESDVFNSHKFSKTSFSKLFPVFQCSLGINVPLFHTLHHFHYCSILTQSLLCKSSAFSVTFNTAGTEMLRGNAMET